MRTLVCCYFQQMSTIGADFSFFFLCQRMNSLPPLPCPLLLSPPLPTNTAREFGGALYAPPVGSGAKPRPTSDLVHFGSQKVQLWWQQFLLIFLKTNVKYRRHSRFTHCRLQIMTSLTSIKQLLGVHSETKKKK